ncbi:unnamed protein product, partial [marine sediment metagenome]
MLNISVIIFAITLSYKYGIYSIALGVILGGICQALVQAPSPKKLLSKLGIMKAIKKASVSIPAPNLLEITISLPKPNTLQNKVAMITIPAYLAILYFVSINLP